jgi:hypothetical protein
VSPVFFPIAALLVAAIAVQIWYARSILKSGVEVNVATKVIWVVNVVLLLGVLGFLTWYMVPAGGA